MHRRLALGLAAATVGVGLPLATAAPSSATITCGAVETVSVSIHYKACLNTSPKEGEGGFKNDHGSSIAVWGQIGYKIDGGATQWRPYVHLLLSSDHDWHKRLADTYCPAGHRVAYQVRATANTNPTGWGTPSTSPTRTC